MRRFRASDERPGIRGLLVGRFNRIARFGFAGVLATVLYFVLVNIIVKGFGTDPVAASVYAYLLSIVFSYLMQSRFTFGVREDTLGQGVRFLAASFAGLGISFWAMSFAVRELGLPYAAGALAVCVLIPLTNYFVFQHWVFARPRGREGSANSERTGTKS